MPAVLSLQYEELSKNYEQGKKIFLNHLDEMQLQVRTLKPQCIQVKVAQYD